MKKNADLQESAAMANARKVFEKTMESGRLGYAQPLKNEIAPEIEKCVNCGNTEIFKHDFSGRPWCEDCAEPKIKQVRHESKPIGRNDPCRCWSGLKYKNCCGKKK